MELAQETNAADQQIKRERKREIPKFNRNRGRRRNEDVFSKAQSGFHNWCARTRRLLIDMEVSLRLQQGDPRFVKYLTANVEYQVT